MQPIDAESINAVPIGAVLNEAASGGRATVRRPLLRPGDVRHELPLATRHLDTVRRGRQAVRSILNGADDRLLVVVGPCSIHDPIAGLEYARRLAGVAVELAGDLCIVMRTYFEKPRTGAGWKGLVLDPGLDGSYRINEGILIARALLRDILSLDLPVGCEFVDPLLSPFLADTVSWGAIGARTSQSPVHRQLASGLPLPVGFKNSPDGDVQVAIDAVIAASLPQISLGVADDGSATVFETPGNPDGHVVLRGGTRGPNFGRADIAAARRRLEGAGLPARVVVDASHGNSGKDHRAQTAVTGALATLVEEDDPGIAGLMVESFLVAGRQPLGTGGGSALTFGQSVTDACMGWEESAETLRILARAVARRRESGSNGNAEFCAAVAR
jgi:3-deoxy-7-phosphoheptulonate synthase